MLYGDRYEIKLLINMGTHKYSHDFLRALLNKQIFSEFESNESLDGEELVHGISECGKIREYGKCM